jgi:hypothetical protein
LEDRLWLLREFARLYVARKPAYFFDVPHIIWSFGRCGLVGIFYEQFVNLCVLALENSFARAGFR